MIDAIAVVTGSGERVDPEIAVPPGGGDVRIGPRGEVSAAVGGALVADEMQSWLLDTLA